MNSKILAISVIFFFFLNGCCFPMGKHIKSGKKSPKKAFLNPSPSPDTNEPKKELKTAPLCFSQSKVETIVKKLQERRVKLEYCQKRFEAVNKALLEQKGICLKKPEKKPNNGPWIAFSVGFLAGGVTLALVVISVLGATK